ncbi:MAG: (5-formylfuran-3-yl)methyl phosphate synthase [Pirellulaceae bacterium]
MAPNLLVSVHEKAEVVGQWLQWVDIIDLKSPKAGALEAVSKESALEICDYIDGRVPLSAALGELKNFKLNSFVHHLSRVQFAKIGLSDCAHRDWEAELGAIWKAFPATVLPVAVAYADWKHCCAPNPLEVVEFAAKHRAEYFLIDTYYKQSGSIFNLVDFGFLIQLRQIAAEKKIGFVLAGSIQSVHAELVGRVSPEVVGVRGAVTKFGRDSEIDANRVLEFRNAIDRSFVHPHHAPLNI